MAERSTRRGGPWRAPAPAGPSHPREVSSRPADALAQLERLLHILPAASREGGARLSDLALDLGVDEATVIEDLHEVQERSFHLPPGSPDISVTIAHDRVSVWTPGEFRRPIRLTPGEGLALGLALRLAALSARLQEPDRREALRAKLETALGRVSEPTDTARHFRAPDLESDIRGMREILLRAAQNRLPCAIRYLKPGAAGAEERGIHPYGVIHAEGHWYVLALCVAAGSVRAFRIDRILDAVPGSGSFEIPDSFDPDDHLHGGRVFRAERPVLTTVRYSPAVARWQAEREEGTWEEDGSFIVQHAVADPDWLVRHVIQLAGEAEVLDPPDLRAMVREHALRLMGPQPSPATSE